MTHTERAPPAPTHRRFALRRAQRLTSAAVGTALQGRRMTTKYFALHFSAHARRGLPGGIATVVPKRLVKRAVDRSRIRRLIRETFRLQQERWDGCACVVRLTSTYTADADYANDLRQLWAKR